MAKPLTDGINALTRYANSVTGQSDATLSEAVASLANGYGQGGGDDFFGLIHIYEATGDGTASLNIPFGETLTWAPQFIAFIAEEPHIVPTGENAIISGSAFRSGQRATSGDLASILAINTMYPNGNYEYWSSWGSISATQTEATASVTRSVVGTFQNGQKFKVLVFETTDLRAY